MSDYINWLKQYQNFDLFILFLLELGYSVADAAKAVDVSRTTVYSVIEKNKTIVQDYEDVVADMYFEARADYQASIDEDRQIQDGQS